MESKMILNDTENKILYCKQKHVMELTEFTAGDYTPPRVDETWGENLPKSWSQTNLLYQAFKLPSLNGGVNSDRSLVLHGLPLFDWIQLQDNEEAIGHGSFGLVFVARANREKVVTYLCGTTSQIWHITHYLL